MITDIAWDFDGTLCDSYPLIIHAFQMALKKVGIEASNDEVRKWVTITVGDATRHFHEHHPFDLDTFMACYRAYDEKIDFGLVEPFAGVEEALKQVISYGGRNHLYTHRLAPSVFQYLEHYDLRKYFSIEFTASQGFPRKPDPTALLALMNVGHIEASHLMMVGDRPIDIDAAHAAHAYSCFYNSNQLPRPAHADYQVDDYGQFCDLLGRLMKKEESL